MTVAAREALSAVNASRKAVCAAASVVVQVYGSTASVEKSAAANVREIPFASIVMLQAASKLSTRSLRPPVAPAAVAPICSTSRHVDPENGAWTNSWRR